MHSFRRLLITRNSLGMHTRSLSKPFSSSVLTHDERTKTFSMKVNSGLATIDYKREGDVLDLVHSYVPETLRGNGIGQILAKATFDYIDQHKLKMIPTCTFLRKIYEENINQYKHLIKE